MNEVRLPPPQLPEETLLLFEHFVVDKDRSDNWRFYFRDDGCFFNARNTELWIDDQALNSTDPEIYWNMPFADEPTRCLTEAQIEALHEAIDAANFSQLKEYYSDPDFNHTVPPSVDRWTLVREGEVHTILVENESGPQELKELRSKINELLLAAPL